MQALAARQSGLAQWRIEVVDLFWRSAALFRLCAKDRSVFDGSGPGFGSGLYRKLRRLEGGGWTDRPSVFK